MTSSTNKKIVLRLTAITTLMAIISLTPTTTNMPVLAASIGQNQLDGDAREAKFNQLYNEDMEFKGIVDTYRKISEKSDDLTPSDWTTLQSLFDGINIKMDGKTLTKEEWDNYMPLFKEAILSKRATLQLKSNGPSVEIDPSSATTASGILLVDTDYMPALYQPTIDFNGGTHNGHTHSGGNGFIRYYVKTFDQTIYGYTLPNKFIYEVTLVFADEDCFAFGSNSCDVPLDNQRLSDWGRIRDLESFFIVADKTSGNVDRLSFQQITLNKSGGGTRSAAGIYTFIKTFDDQDHQDTQDSTWTYHSGRHMKIWVNTWNHAMTDVDTNPDLSDTLSEVWLFTKNTGARWNAENSESTMSYTGESLSRAP